MKARISERGRRILRNPSAVKAIVTALNSSANSTILKNGGSITVPVNSPQNTSEENAIKNISLRQLQLLEN
jgi:hypothetical protein